MPQAVAAPWACASGPGQPLTATLVDAISAPDGSCWCWTTASTWSTPARALAEALLRACPACASSPPAASRWASPARPSGACRSLALPDARQPPPTGRARGGTRRCACSSSARAAAEPGFALTDENAAAVAQVCRRLDGIPLAIELAAARVRRCSASSRSPARLDDRFRLLTGGSRARRCRASRRCAATSTGATTCSREPERALLRARLAVFAGGWTLEAAEAVCAGDGIERRRRARPARPRWWTSRWWSRRSSRGEARYRLLETIRQYGEEKLQAAGEAIALRARHCDWYVALAEEGERALRGPRSEAWIERLDRELPNLRAALDWSHAQPDGAEAELWLFAGLGQFFCIRGYFNEGRERGAAALARLDEASPVVAAHACIVEAPAPGSAASFPRRGGTWSAGCRSRGRRAIPGGSPRRSAGWAWWRRTRVTPTAP